MTSTSLESPQCTQLKHILQENKKHPRPVLEAHVTQAGGCCRAIRYLGDTGVWVRGCARVGDFEMSSRIAVKEEEADHANISYPETLNPKL